MPRYAKKIERTNITISVPTELLTWVDNRAGENGLSRTAMMTMMLIIAKDKLRRNDMKTERHLQQ